MSILKNSVVFLTGADGGIGRAFIDELIKREVSKIYITGLNIEILNEISCKNPSILFPLKLDITNSEDINNCIKSCNDVNILINNAGIELKSDFFNEKSADCAKLEMEINYIGIIRLTNSFLDILKTNNNSGIINILSVGSLLLIDRLSTYCVSKVATHIYTQTIRKNLKNKNIKVFGVYPGYVDTSMSSDIEKEQKINVEELLYNICNDIENNKYNIFPDKMSKKYEESTKLNIDFL